MDALGIVAAYDPSSLRKLNYTFIRCVLGPTTITVPNGTPFIIVFNPDITAWDSNPSSMISSTIVARGGNVRYKYGSLGVFISFINTIVTGEITTNVTKELIVSLAYPVL